MHTQIIIRNVISNGKFFVNSFASQMSQYKMKINMM
jgi:hypothetical protein